MMYKHREKQNNDFSAFVRKIRERLQVNQAELAKAVGVTTPRISDWERGISTPSERYLPVIKSQLSELLAKEAGAEKSWGPYLQITVFKGGTKDCVYVVSFLGSTHLFYDKLEVKNLIRQFRDQAGFLEKNLGWSKKVEEVKTKPGKAQ